MGRLSPLKRPSCSQEKAETSLRADATLVIFLPLLLLVYAEVSLFII